MASPTTVSNSYKLAKYAQAQNISTTEFPAEWWDARPRGSTTAARTPREILLDKQTAFDNYDTEMKEKYRTFMSGIENLEGFVRIVSQNMHCRDEGLPGSVFSCEGGVTFHDNQAERAIELAKRIQSGTMKADIIAIQELQSKRARAAFEAEMKKNKRYKFWIPGVSATVFTMPIYSGQAFAYDSTKVKLIEKKMWVFPVELSSGADTITRSHSFKGMAWARFETIPREGQEKYTLSVFNIHPSPYVQTDSVFTPRAKYDLQIVASHIYQFILVSMKIKELMLAQRATGKTDSVFILGDWNVNKYFQNGFNENAVAPGMATAEARTRSVAANTVMGRGFRTVTRKNSAGRTITGVEQVEGCFRDDIPFTGKPVCDYGACCGSEYMTCLEILGAIPPTHLFSLSEHDEDIPAPYGGKYTWDGLMNSVMWSPFWSSRAFQLLDHIVYSKFGHIPIYAHTMTKRYLTTKPVAATEGPLSVKCRTPKKIPDNLKYYMAGTDMATDKYQYVDLADHYAVECVAILSYRDTVATTLATSAATFYKDAKFWTDSFYPNFGGGRAPKLQHFMLPKLWQFLKTGDLQEKVRISKQYLGVRPDVLPETLAARIKELIVRFRATEYPLEILTNLPSSYKAKVVNDFAFKMANRLLEREFINRQFLSNIEIPKGVLSCATKGDEIYKCNVTRKARSPRGKARAAVFKKLDIGEMVDFEKAYADLAGDGTGALARSPDLITIPAVGPDWKIISPTDRRTPTPLPLLPASPVSPTEIVTPREESRGSFMAGVHTVATAMLRAGLRSGVFSRLHL